jgi:hypothetical protein
VTKTSLGCPEMSVARESFGNFTAPHGIIAIGRMLVARVGITAIGTVVTRVDIIAMIPTIIHVGIPLSAGTRIVDSVVGIGVVVVVLVVVIAVVVLLLVVIVVATAAIVVAKFVVMLFLLLVQLDRPAWNCWSCWRSWLILASFKAC